MRYRIREAVVPDDYAGLVAVHNLVQPETPAALQDYRDHDARLDPTHHFKRWVAVVDDAPTPGGIVAEAQVAQYAWTYHPHKFNLRLWVAPAYRGQGIGTALAECIQAFLAPLEPVTLWAWTRENRTDGLRFAERYGFVEEARFEQLKLDLSPFDAAAFGDLEGSLAAQGITLHTLAELAADPEHEVKAWRLDMAISADLPGEEELQEISLAEWRKQILEDSGFLPEGYVVAVREGEYVGMTQLVTDHASDLLYTGLTGVARDWRRRGIALALKVRALAWAREQGYAGVNTGSEAGNVGMLAINQRLGFKPQPAGIKLARQIDLARQVSEEIGAAG